MQKFGLNKWDYGKWILDNGWGFGRFVDKWMGMLGRSTWAHTLKGGRVVDERICN